MGERRVYALVFSLVLLLGCSRREKKPDPLDDYQGPPPVPAPAPKATATDTPLERAERAESFTEAWDVSAPYMADTRDALDEGSLMLFRWAMRAMTWADVAVQKDETSHALAMKDPDEARGKRLCAPGTIVEIHAVKRGPGKGFEGLLLSYANNIFRFLAAGSSGTLVQGRNARFCGVVTGTYDYPNSAGGTGHAVKVVGMFDLAENRNAAPVPVRHVIKPSQPAPSGPDCTNPFTVDGHGVRRPRPECVRR